MLLVGSANNRILVLGEVPDHSEVITGVPFISSSKNGYYLNRILARAGINIKELSLGYIWDKPQPGNLESLFTGKDLEFPKPELAVVWEDLRDYLRKHPPNIVIALGKVAMKLLTGSSHLEGGTGFRGYILNSTIMQDPEKEFQVIPTFPMTRIQDEPFQEYTVLQDFRKAMRNSVHKHYVPPEKVFVPDATPDQFIEYCDFILTGKGDFPYKEDLESGIGFDIENTYGHGCHITQFGIGHSLHYAMTIRFLEGSKALLSEADEVRVISKIAELAEASHKGLKVIAHNGGHDLAVTWMNFSCLFRISFDTMLAAQLLFPELLKSLGFLASICLNVPPWKHISGETTYNPEDVANTKGIYEVLRKQLEMKNLMSTHDFEISQLPMARMMELQGIKIDLKAKAALEKLYQEQEVLLMQQLKELTSKFGEINFNSPKQVQKLLYEDLKLPPQYKRRKSVKDPRKVSTDAESLTALCNKTNSPIPRLILQYKKISKALSSYINFAVSPEGTIHTTYNIGSVVESKPLKLGQEQNRSLGRWSSSSSIIKSYGPGNFQSIPNYARSMVVPFSPDNCILAFDLRQAEAVIVAYLSEDQYLINLIETGVKLRRQLVKLMPEMQNGLGPNESWPAEVGRIQLALDEVDLHKAKAALIFEKPIALVGDGERQVGKAINHSENYAAGPKVLQAKLAEKGVYVNMRTCQNYLEKSARKSPARSRWQEGIRKEFAKNGGYLENPLGRKRYFLNAFNNDLFKRLYAFKPQSTIGDVLNEVMLKFYNNYCWKENIRLLMQLHDGFYVEVPKSQAAFYAKAGRECMLRPIPINSHQVTVDIEVKQGVNWKDLKEIYV